MPIYMTLIFLMVVSGMSFALSAYTLSRLYDLLDSTSVNLIKAEAFIWLDQPRAWGISAMIILSYFMIGKVLPTRGLRWLGWVSGLWMGYIVILLFFAGPIHLFEWTLSMLSLIDTGAHPKFAMTTLVIVHIAFVLGIWGAIRSPRISHVEIRSKRIGPELDGFTILQFSDVHIGPTIGQRLIRYLHARSAELNPDLIVMTGDLVDGEPRHLKADVNQFLELKKHARFGLYFITGNHEYISGGVSWVNLVRQSGVSVLENEHVTLNVGDERLHLIGVEDWDAQRFDPQRAPHLKQALAGIEDSEHFKLLLAHQPKAAREASELGIDLQLSGRTHAG